MAAIAQEFGYFFNSNNSDRKYNAESFEEWLKPFFVSGVFTGSLEVTELDTPGMGVKVNSGYANLDGKVARWTSNNTIAVATASGVYDRIDTIVLRRDNTNRQISLDIVTGVAAANPQPTAPTRDSDTFELVLAQIYVGMGDTEITQSDITDTRLDPDLCGYVCAAVQSPDFSDLYDQFTAQFMVWFDHMKDQLDDDAAGHLQLEIDAITANIGTVPPGKTLQGEIETVEQIDDDLGIVVRNNKIAKAGVSATEGQYIILRESTIAGCADGLYKATQAIPANTAIDATYLTAVSGGGLNDLNNNFKWTCLLQPTTISNDSTAALSDNIENYNELFIQMHTYVSASTPYRRACVGVIPVAAIKAYGYDTNNQFIISCIGSVNAEGSKLNYAEYTQFSFTNATTLKINFREARGWNGSYYFTVYAR